MIGFLILPVTVGVLSFVVVAIVTSYLKRRGGPVVSRYQPLFAAATSLGAAPISELHDRLLLRAPSGLAFTVGASDHNKHGPQKLWIGAPVKTGPPPFGERDIPRLPRVVVRHETARDRLGKRLGLNLEPQTGDPAFDAEAYIETDDPEIALAILRTPRVAAVLREILYHTDANVSFNAQGQGVIVEWETRGRPIDIQYVQACVHALERLVAAMPAVRELRIEATSSGLRVALVILGTLLGVVALLGGSAYFLTMRPPLGPGAFATAATASLVVMAAGVVLGWIASRRRPRGLARFLTLGLLVISFGPFFAAAGFSAGNSVLDSTREREEVKVLARRVTTGKSSSYYLTVSKFGGLPKPVEIQVSSRQYGAVQGKTVTIEYGRGALGYPWVRDVAP